MGGTGRGRASGGSRRPRHGSGVAGVASPAGWGRGRGVPKGGDAASGAAPQPGASRVRLLPGFGGGGRLPPGTPRATPAPRGTVGTGSWGHRDGTRGGRGDGARGHSRDRGCMAPGSRHVGTMGTGHRGHWGQGSWGHGDGTHGHHEDREQGTLGTGHRDIVGTWHSGTAGTGHWGRWGQGTWGHGDRARGHSRDRCTGPQGPGMWAPRGPGTWVRRGQGSWSHGDRAQGTVGTGHRAHPRGTRRRGPGDPAGTGMAGGTVGTRHGERPSHGDCRRRGEGTHTRGTEGPDGVSPSPRVAVTRPPAAQHPPSPARSRTITGAGSAPRPAQPYKSHRHRGGTTHNAGDTGRDSQVSLGTRTNWVPLGQQSEGVHSGAY